MISSLFVADTLQAKGLVSPGNAWVLPSAVALLVCALAAVPLLKGVNACTLSSFMGVSALAAVCAWRIAKKARSEAALAAHVQPASGASGGSALIQLLLGILPVWRRHVLSSRTQIEEAVTDLVVNFTSISDEFEAAGFKGAAGVSCEQDDETSALLARCENALREVITAMNEITQSKGDMTASMQELSQATKDLQSMAQGVAQIAAQTNLLAINAAIEAAHAGDAGRGFATIAKEIRMLSHSSAQTASQITDRIARVTGIMIGTSQAAASAAHQEEAIVHRSSDAVTDVLMHMRQLSADSKTMRERGNAIRGNIEQLIVSMQFQDRVSQVLSVVDGDITRLRDQVERDEPAPESAQWLNDLERHYTMREQHLHAASSPHEGTPAPARKAVFF